MDDARDRRTLEPPEQAAEHDYETAERVEDEVDETSMLYAGTSGAEARDLAGGEDGSGGPPPPYGSREEVLESAMGEQREIEAAQGSTPAADPSQRSGFNRILSFWTFVGALLGAGVGAFAGWLAVHYKDSSYPIIIALAAVGVIVGAVIVGAYRVEAEDGRVQEAVESEVDEARAGTPGDEEPDAEAPRAPVGTRSGG
jgi:hypothetical protein